MERPIDFSRQRHMLCGSCGHRWVTDLNWIDRWDQARERCPGCGVTCEAEAAPRVTVDPHDLALSDSNVAQLNWYHTSTQPDWPTPYFDPAAELTQETRQRMGGDSHVIRWAERQRAKALHVGTYEAAIHNMLRRIDDQGDRGAQFYLYRVRLVPTLSVRKGWLIDPSNFVGDVVLNEVCSPGTDVARYLNYHEDPGALSLALGRTAIDSTQRVAIPLPSKEKPPWVVEAIGELDSASVIAPAPTGSRPLGRRRMPSPRTNRARELAASLARGLPVNLRWQFESAAVFGDDLVPADWACYVRGVVDLILDPARVLGALDGQLLRQLRAGQSGSGEHI